MDAIISRENQKSVNRMSRAESVWFGMLLPYRALRLILKEKVLLFLSLLPVGITGAISYGMVTLLYGFLKEFLLQQVARWGWGPESWEASALMWTGKILLVLVSVFSFSILASAVAAPLNDFIAEKAESRAQPPLPAVPPVSFLARLRLIRIDLLKTLAAVLMSFFAILISWVPLLNFLALLMTFMLMTFEFISYPQTRRGQGMSAGLSFLFRRKFASVGFGATLTLLFSIPFVSIFALPVAVVGGTLLVARAQKGIDLPELR